MSCTEYVCLGANQLRKINGDPVEKYIDNDEFEKLTNALVEHTYQLMVDAGLKKIYVPSKRNNTLNFVFGTKTNFQNTDKLLLFVNGSGKVRAGQWARALILFDSIEHGTMIPDIQQAIKLGFDVLVLNTNNNFRMVNGAYFNIPNQQQEHITAVWEQLVEPAFHQINTFGIVAHSAGGNQVLKLANDYPDEFIQKCFAIAFTDSTLWDLKSLPSGLHDWFIKVINFTFMQSRALNKVLFLNLDGLF